MSFLKPYLAALGISAQANKLELMNQIVAAHLAKYSFNNVDLLLQKDKILSLELTDIFDKIVTRRRGGYCFEHNKLLFEMAVEKGIVAEALLARVTFGGSLNVPLTHRITLLTIDGSQYLADVGFGRLSPSCLIPMSGEKVSAPNGEIFRISRLEDGDFALETWEKGRFVNLYTVNGLKCQEADFELANYYTCCFPTSTFRHSLTIAIKTKLQSKYIKHGVYTCIEKGVMTTQAITSEKQVKRLLSKEFDYVVSDQEVSLICTDMAFET